MEKLDWMYATPSAQDGGTSALGGARMDDKAMEDYLLGKRRVDDVLKAGEKNVSWSKYHRTCTVTDIASLRSDRRPKQRLYRRPKRQLGDGYCGQDPRRSTACHQTAGASGVSSDDE